MTREAELHPLPEFHTVPDEYSPPFQRTIGVKMGVGVGGEGIAWVDVDPEVHYGNTWAHGGLAGALADIASGIAIARRVPNPYESIDGTVEMKVNFIRKVVDGDFTACARILHLGKRIAVTDVELTNRGVLCAKAIATFMLRDPEPQ